MPYNGAGTFVRVHDWTQDRANGVNVNADRMDAEHDGFATGLSTAITKDGQTTVTADLPMNSHKLTGLAAGTVPGDSVRYEQLSTLFPEVPTVGTGNDTLTTDDVAKLHPYDASAGAITVTLPSAVDVGSGSELTIVKSDQSGNFVIVNSVNGELLGYPGKSYAFHATPATAVQNNGGFVRVQMADENYGVFRTGDKVRIAGAVGFAALNADHVITRPLDATGEAYRSVDLNSLAYAAGYTSGGTVAFIQIQHIIRVIGGTVTYISNGTHWVVKYATSDIFLGARDELLHARNPDFDGPQIAISDINDIDAYFNAHSGRFVARDAKFIARGDPGDLTLAKASGERFGTDSLQTVANSSVYTIYWQASAQDGSIAGQLGSITVKPEEDVSTVGNGAYMLFGTSAFGKREVETFLHARQDGEVWIGGANERGTIRAYTGRAVPAEKRLTASGNVADGDTVTIDTKVYTFESGALDAASPTAVEVLLGATAGESMANLVAAINATGTSGVTYGAGNVRHTTVHAVHSPGDSSIINVYARTGGTAGNSIVIGEVSGTLVWLGGATTLSGGLAINMTQIGVEGDSLGTKVTVHAEGISGATNVALRLDAKGSAYVHTENPLIVNTTATGVNTAGDVSYTAAQVLGGLIIRDCNGAARADTLPAAAALVAAIPGAAIGDTVRCYIVNGSDAAETITFTEGAGGSWASVQLAASRVLPQLASKTLHFRLTNVTAASEAYVVYA